MVGGSRGRSPQFLRRVQNRPALRRRGSMAVLLRLLLVAAGLGIGGGGAWALWTQVLDSPTFHLRELELRAVPEGLRPAVRRRLDPALGHNLVMLDLGRLQRWVAGIPQVQEASLRRQLPDTLFVSVTARRPWGTLHADDGLWSIDREGVLLRRLSRPDPGLHRIRLPHALEESLDGSGRVPSTLPGSEMLPQAIRIADWIEEHAAPAFPSAAHLRLEPGGVVLVSIGGDWEINLGEARRLATKHAGLQALLRERPPRGPSRVDLRYRDMVVVRALEGDTGEQQE